MTQAALKPGTVIDGYEVVGLLGRGGMGAVYRVRRGDSEYALKTLTLAGSGEMTSEEVVRFRREGELLGALRHPGVVRVVSAGAKPGFFYYVMRLIEGESLEGRIKRTGALPPDEAVSLVLEVADAIAHAHEKGIVHRDLKPANVMMDGDGRPLVTDFGLARQLGEKETERLTKTGEILGTPAYLAPEQAFGLKAELDEKTDVYGLGALLYALLAGRPPFEGPSALIVLKNVSTEPPAPLENVAPELEAFVLRAMAKRREDRPPTARAFMEELRAVSESAPLVSRRALAFFAFALLAGVAFVLGAFAWKKGSVEKEKRLALLSGRLAAIASTVAALSLDQGRAQAASSLDEFANDLREARTQSLRAEGEGAFSRGDFDRARACLDEWWLGAPRTDEEGEGLLVAALLEAAARRELEAGDRPSAEALRERARTASQHARESALERLQARVDANAGALAPAAPAASWAAALLDLDAACHATSAAPGVRLDALHRAALVLSGKGSASALANVTTETIAASPALEHAAEKLYRDALGASEKKREALEALASVPPPRDLAEPVSDFWWQVTLADKAQASLDVDALWSDIGAAAFKHDTRAFDLGINKALKCVGRVLVPFGRALQANPARDAFPDELAPFISFLRLGAKTELSLRDESVKTWSEALATLGDHPLAVYVRAKRFAVTQKSRSRGDWPEAARRDFVALVNRALPGLRKARRTDHVRVLAADFVGHALTDEVDDRPARECLEAMRPFAEIASYTNAWDPYAMALAHVDEAAGRALFAETRGVPEAPHYLVEAEEFLAKEPSFQHPPR